MVSLWWDIPFLKAEISAEYQFCIMGGATDGPAAEVRLLKRLKTAKIPVTYQPIIGGIKPDFFTQTPYGRKIVIEMKNWSADHTSYRRALSQANYYRISTGADRVFLVIPSLKEGNPKEGIVNEDQLIEALAGEFRKNGEGKGTEVLKLPTPQHGGKRKKMIFAAMPFKPEYDDVYFVAMVASAKTVGAVCNRVDYLEYSGDIVEEMRKQIASCDVVIADLSGSEPNVLYEVGYTHALGKPSVHVCSTPLSMLPFDISHWNTIRYQQGQTIKLKSRLVSRLKATLP